MAALYRLALWDGESELIKLTEHLFGNKNSEGIRVSPPLEQTNNCTKYPFDANEPIDLNNLIKEYSDNLKTMVVLCCSHFFYIK